MKISITITSEYNRLFGHDFTRLMDVGRWAEAAGIDQLDIAEHLLMGDGKSYPFGEKRMLAKARQILVSELALAEKTDEEKAEVILDEVLAS